jgi:hypothetical protein
LKRAIAVALELILHHYDFSCFEVWRRIVDAIRELTAKQ